MRLLLRLQEQGSAQPWGGHSTVSIASSVADFLGELMIAEMLLALAEEQKNSTMCLLNWSQGQQLQSRLVFNVCLPAYLLNYFSAILTLPSPVHHTITSLLFVH
jgi:hypothetical protein